MEKKLLLAKSLLQTCFFAMKNQRNIASLVGSIALISFFEFLFRQGEYGLYLPGINVLFFSVVSLTLAIALYQPALKNKVFWWGTFGAIASAINITYHTDDWSIMMYMASHFIVVGSIQSESNKNIMFALLQWLLMQFSAPFYTIKFLVDSKNWKSDSRTAIWKIAKLVLIPFIIVTAFITMYSYANPQFEKLISTPILNFFEQFVHFNFMRLFTWLIGAMLVIPLLIPIQYKQVILNPQQEQKHVKRKRKVVKRIFKTLDLSNELRISTMTLVGLNLIIFLFNALDIVYVWISSSPKTASELSKYVHAGTNMVILSIVIGSALILFFFRNNIHFHPKNAMVKRLSLVWLAQNAFLALSTLRRNLTYVNEYGLTMKRLGVVIFVTLVLIGLYFTYEKVFKQHTIQYFLSRIMLATYLTLVGFSLIDHPRLMILHAVYLQEENVDIAHLQTVSHDHRYLLQRHAPILSKKSAWTELEILDQKIFSSQDNWRDFTLLSHINRKNLNIDHQVIELKKPITKQTILPAIQTHPMELEEEKPVFVEEPIPEE